jgi:uncharacterized membrane protein YagU involved in acid resistance
LVTGTMRYLYFFTDIRICLNHFSFVYHFSFSIIVII